MTSSDSELIDANIQALGDWRGETLARLRAAIQQADPEVTEEVKWRKPSNPLGVPTWSHDGIICTGETYKSYVKLTFAKGASLEDPAGLFNASFGGGVRRAIDFHEGEKVNERALKSLVKSAVALNQATKGGRGGPAKDKGPSGGGEVKLLSGGNPQMPKGDGDAPVQAYIAAMPGWKRDAGRKLDALIERTVPGVVKGVRWNSPFYGVEGQGWFVSYHCFDKYIKVTFFRGTSLDPLPPVESKDAETRFFHVYEDKAMDEAQVTSWIKQASKTPGWIP